MQTIWLGGTDFKHEGKHVWHDEQGTLVQNGYQNWNSGQVSKITFFSANDFFSKKSQHLCQYMNYFALEHHIIILKMLFRSWPWDSILRQKIFYLSSKDNITISLNLLIQDYETFQRSRGQKSKTMLKCAKNLPRWLRRTCYLHALWACLVCQKPPQHVNHDLRI